MAGLVGVILVGMALFSIGAVMFMIMREHHEAEEWYQPGQASATGTASVVTPAAPIAPSAPIAPVAAPAKPEEKPAE